VAILTVNDAQVQFYRMLKRPLPHPGTMAFITVEPKLQAGEPVLDKNGKPETQLKINWDKLPSLRIGRYNCI